MFSGGFSLYLHLQLALWKGGLGGETLLDVGIRETPARHSLHFSPRNLRNTQSTGGNVTEGRVSVRGGDNWWGPGVQTAAVPRCTQLHLFCEVLHSSRFWIIWAGENKPGKLTKLQEEEGERCDCHAGRRRLQGRNKLVQGLWHTAPEIPAQSGVWALWFWCGVQGEAGNSPAPHCPTYHTAGLRKRLEGVRRLRGSPLLSLS